ncbi:DDE-type integrase/transposase/recombinase [Stenomitos frigidus]|uniref:DDE-type integrase/transposase/recombinase n=1 Tax=Stenomitos frigidus TaxID=1886765 RepID=UPI003296C51E
MNHIIEPEHRNSKRLVKPRMGCKSFNRARSTLSGIEAMKMMRKGQVNESSQGNGVSQAKFVGESCGGPLKTIRLVQSVCHFNKFATEPICNHRSDTPVTRTIAANAKRSSSNLSTKSRVV